MFGEFAVLRRGKARSPLGMRQWSIDLSVVVGLIRAGTRGKVRQLAEQHVQLHRRTRQRDALGVRAEFRACGFSQEPQSGLRIGIRDDGGGGNALARFEQDAFSGYDRGHGNARRDHRSRLSRSIAQ